jgi:SAM-dependent methyltransferase
MPPEMAMGQRLALLARYHGFLEIPIVFSRRWMTRLFLAGPEVRTLDLGCGEGRLTLAAARGGGYALGISNNREALQRGMQTRELVGLPPERAEFRCADLRTWQPAPDEQYDQVFLFNVLEHLLDDASLLRRARSVLKPNGLLFVSAPNRAASLRERCSHVSRHENGWHVRHGYTFEQMEELLGRCGLEAVDRRGVGWGGSQALWRLTRDLPLPRPLRGIVRAAVCIALRPVAWIVDWVPVGEPYYILVKARRTARE